MTIYTIIKYVEIDVKRFIVNFIKLGIYKLKSLWYNTFVRVLCSGRMPVKQETPLP